MFFSTIFKAFINSFPCSLYLFLGCLLFFIPSVAYIFSKVLTALYSYPFSNNFKPFRPLFFLIKIFSSLFFSLFVTFFRPSLVLYPSLRSSIFSLRVFIALYVTPFMIVLSLSNPLYFLIFTISYISFIYIAKAFSIFLFWPALPRLFKRL